MKEIKSQVKEKESQVKKLGLVELCEHADSTAPPMTPTHQYCKMKSCPYNIGIVFGDGMACEIVNYRKTRC